MARILVLSNWYPPHHHGGYEILCQDVMRGLHEQGHQIEVLCSDTELPGVGPETSPFPVQRSLQMYWRDDAPWSPALRQQLAMERTNQATLLEALERFQPDVVSVWQMGALSLNLLTTVIRRRIPMLYAVSDEWLIYGMALDPWSGRWYRNPLRRAAGHIAESLLHTPTVVADLGPSGIFCFASAFTQRATVAASPWRYPHAVVIHSGVNLARFPPADRTDAPPWQGRLLLVGRLDPRKGTDTALRALAQLPGATLTFAGRGDQREQARLTALAADLGVGDRTTFEGFVGDGLADLYRTHDCLLFPSEWPEPFGMVPLEAMASGVPVIATGDGGSAEYLQDRVNCLRFTAGDADALARSVTALSADAVLRGRLVEGGLRTARDFDGTKTIAAFAAQHLLAAQGVPEPGTVPTPKFPLRTRLGHWWRGWYR